MKHLLAIALVFGISSVHAEAVMQKVCHDDAKGKPVCKTIKTHKKVEGTAVPEKAPAPTKKK
jgi:hypothetical protein